MADAINPVRKAIEKFEAVKWASSGDPVMDENDPDFIAAGWVKFAIKKSELGWRTLEFIAWLTNDMVRGGERLHFFPTAPPPYLNEPGECLAFVIEIYPENDDGVSRFKKAGKFMADCRKRYWKECLPGV